MASKLAGKWKAVQGEEKWKGLLDPLDEDLCKELIRYGQFVQTVYDSYNHSAVSATLGYSRYGKSEFFEKLHVKAGYTIHKYIYCTVLLESLLGKVVQGVVDLAGGFTGNVTSWFGYVAVSDDEETKRLGRRDIVIVFRGTQEDLEWANNLLNTFKGDIVSAQPNIEPMSGLPPLNPDKASDTPVTTTTTTTKRTGFGLVGGVLSTVKEVTVGVVHLLPWQKALIGNRWLIPYTATNEGGNGFGKKSARIQVIEAISELIELYKDEELSITVTGHSLGAAIATVCAYDIANEKKNVNPVTGKTIPVTAFTFASPRVGNLEFRDVVSKMPGLAMLRIASITDIVPQVPPLLLYIHAGEDFLSFGVSDIPQFEPG